MHFDRFERAVGAGRRSRADIRAGLDVGEAGADRGIDRVRLLQADDPVLAFARSHIQRQAVG